MITVEKVVEKNTHRNATVAKDNQELLSTGTVKEVKKSYLPWILLATAAMFAGWYFLIRKGSGTNEGVPD